MKTNSKHQDIYLKCLLVLVYYLTHFIGMSPFYYNRKLGQFQTSYRFLIYPICIAIFAISSYGLILICLLVYFQVLLRLALVYFRIVSIAVIFVCQCLNYKKIVKCLNNLHQTLNRINQLATLNNIDTECSVKSLLTVSAEYVISFICSIVGFAGIVIIGAQSLKLSCTIIFAAIIYIILLYFWNGTIINSYFGINWIIASHYRRINDSITALMAEAKCLQGTVGSLSVYKKMIKFCELSDRLDDLAAAHGKLTDVFTEVNNILAIQLLTGIAFYFVSLITSVSCIFKVIFKFN